MLIVLLDDVGFDIGSRQQQHPSEEQGAARRDPETQWLLHWEVSPVGPFHQWPTGSGFEYRRAISSRNGPSAWSKGGS